MKSVKYYKELYETCSTSVKEVKYCGEFMYNNKDIIIKYFDKPRIYEYVFFGEHRIVNVTKVDDGKYQRTLSRKKDDIKLTDDIDIRYTKDPYELLFTLLPGDKLSEVYYFVKKYVSLQKIIKNGQH